MNNNILRVFMPSMNSAGQKLSQIQKTIELQNEPIVEGIEVVGTWSRNQSAGDIPPLEPEFEYTLKTTRGFKSAKLIDVFPGKRRQHWRTLTIIGLNVHK